MKCLWPALDINPILSYQKNKKAMDTKMESSEAIKKNFKFNDDYIFNAIINK